LFSPNMIVTLAFDSWTNCNHDKILNIMLLTDGHAHYWTSINCGSNPDTSENEVRLIGEVIEDLRRRGIQLYGIV
jgi:hypothetical protein